MKRNYHRPTIMTEMSFETSALQCGKTSSPPAYDTFSSHFGGNIGSRTESGQCGTAFGPGSTFPEYGYTGLCGHWVAFSS